MISSHRVCSRFDNRVTIDIGFGSRELVNFGLGIRIDFVNLRIRCLKRVNVWLLAWLVFIYFIQFRLFPFQWFYIRWFWWSILNAPPLAPQPFLARYVSFTTWTSAVGRLGDYCTAQVGAP